ncbi:hypothetical protein CEP52_003414 [Fusarium oligoseptatum]|uniref:C2H2-type domain-containing protein n=1 Tax=Fusarium oligoseptatum TaxID=2604345 RepID=A0A428U938_9HYPO|nr:hypothetical protein CEP52_003414 [Fusarium oligoseptatum]
MSFGNQYSGNTGHWGPRYDCWGCNETFPSQDEVNLHMENARHWQIRVFCEDCKVLFYTKQHVDEHLKSNICSRRFYFTPGENFLGQGPFGSKTTQSSSSGMNFSCETCNIEFQSQKDADIHREVYRHMKPSMIDGVELVTKNHIYRDRIEKLFVDGWRDKTKTSSIKCIYIHTQRAKELVDYLKRGEAMVLFHGTQRACHVGDPDHPLRVCNNVECHLCGILRDGFKLDRADSEGMFGPGIYTTDVSSKADKFVMNHHMHSKMHVMLLCAVLPGRSEKLYRADRERRGPSTGYQSVEGAVFAEGGALKYPEIVLYSEDRVVPFGMIVYTRKGWKPL